MIISKSVRIIAIFLIISFSGILISDAAIVVLNGLTHELRVQPGETYRGSITIRNNGKKAKSVRVYQRDYWFNYKGESKHDQPGTLERSNGGWISFNPVLLKLEAKENATIDFEVAVPDNDSLTGTYWSVIMVEGITPPDTSGVKKGIRINTAIRYAVQIITNIGNTGKSDIQFLGLELAHENEKNVLHVVIENTGERVLRPEMNLELFDESGNSAGIIKSDLRVTFPGTSIMSTLILDGIKPGSYTGVLIADCGEDNLFGSNLSLEIE